MTTYINDLSGRAVTRQPRGIVKINGTVVPGWVEFEVDNNSFFHADTFRCKFATSALPDSYNSAWWSSQSEIFIELFAGFPANPQNFTANDLDSLIYGRVDELTYDPAGVFIDINGRDLTAEFIDAKTYEQFVEHTASEIVVELAARHGMTAVVIHTPTKAGTYYQLENRRIPLDRTEWDLLTWLAQEEGFNVYVKGTELHFEPQTAPDAAQYALRWQQATTDGAHPVPTFNGISLVCSRNLTLARDIKVLVRAWGMKASKPFTVTAQPNHIKTATSKGSQRSAGPAQVYSFVRAGLNQVEAQQFANKMLADLSAHEMKISVSMPADNLLKLSNLISLSGTGTAFDQTYFPDSIIRKMSVSMGYIMNVSAKNHSPESTVLA